MYRVLGIFQREPLQPSAFTFAVHSFYLNVDMQIFHRISVSEVTTDNAPCVV